MPLECINVGAPKLPERRKPVVDLPEWLRPNSIHAPLGIDARLDEARFSQNA